MARYLAFALSVVLCLASGCSSRTRYWYQEGKSFEECKQDRDACLTELRDIPDVKSATRAHTRQIRDCMAQKGYRLVTQDKLSYGVERVPPTRIHLEENGLAGTR